MTTARRQLPLEQLVEKFYLRDFGPSMTLAELKRRRDDCGQEFDFELAALMTLATDAFTLGQQEGIAQMRAIVQRDQSDRDCVNAMEEFLDRHVRGTIPPSEEA